jgi:hypothetical protein
MARGKSLHIGLNRVDPTKYNGWDGALGGCVNDANAYKAIADQVGYQSKLLINEEATSQAVVQEIGESAKTLQSDDIFLLTYAGHGGSVPDSTGDEEDAKDETWVLYDRMLLDDELYQLWAQFAPGVRIFMLSDSCHSGTVAREMVYQDMVESQPMLTRPMPPEMFETWLRGMKPDTRAARECIRKCNEVSREVKEPPKFRMIKPDIGADAYAQNRSFYDTVQWTSGGLRVNIEASVLLIAGCQDNQLSMESGGSGLFTKTLTEVWNHGSFDGTYADFHNDIVNRMPATQTPNLFKVGATNAEFEAQKPFTITKIAEISDGKSTPWIEGPSSITPSDPPPEFIVNPGSNRYYVVEVTTDPKLFHYANHSGERIYTDKEDETDHNFYRSWKEKPFGFSTYYPASFKLPQVAWDRLRSGETALYYRLWATDSKDSWVNQVSTTPDSDYANAKVISISREGDTEAPREGPEQVAC